jgi:hypothetical protein
VVSQWLRLGFCGSFSFSPLSLSRGHDIFRGLALTTRQKHLLSPRAYTCDIDTPAAQSVNQRSKKRRGRRSLASRPGVEKREKKARVNEELPAWARSEARLS